MAATSAISNRLNHYKNMRSVPALLSVAFVAASLYQFNGVSAFELVWVGYTITAEHAALASVAIFAIAFMSSETTDFQYYDTWEQVLIVAGPVLILGQQYLMQIDDLLLQLGDPLGYQVAFLLTLFSWGVAVGK